MKGVPMQVTSRASRRAFVAVIAALCIGLVTGCSSPSSPDATAPTPQLQQSASPSPSVPVAQCVVAFEEAAPIAGPVTYTVQFASQEDYDKVVRLLKAKGLTPAEGGDGRQERFWVTLDDVSEFIAPGDVANLQGISDEYRLITDYEEGTCTTAI